MSADRVAAMARQFAIDGEFASAAPFGSGHINDTYCAEYVSNGTRVRAILQRINDRTFRSIPALMENIERVTRHLSAKVAGEPDSERRALRLIPTRDGSAWLRDEDGGYWRAYRMIERARTFDTVQSIAQAFEAGKAFGRFQQLLADLPAPRLHDTIPDFHHTPKRFAALQRAIERDAAGRAKTAAEDIAFALARRGLAGALVTAGLPERIVHNDTKLNNVLFDEASGRALCVIDLDTVMPGLAPCDFGDMVRTATCGAAEDERDLTKVAMQLPLFEALLRGYASAAGGFLTRAERSLLAVAGLVITYEQGIRFLTDDLAGDRYYRVHRERHNLDRCRAQFALLASMERQEAAMERLVRTICD